MFRSLWRTFSLKKYEILCLGGLSIYSNNYSSCNDAKDKLSVDTNLEHFWKYVIVGFGEAGRAACSEILASDDKYKHKLLAIDSNFKNLTENENIYINERVRVIGSEVAHIDLPSRIIKFRDDSVVYFDKCLISTGSSGASFDERFIDLSVRSLIFDAHNVQSWWPHILNLISKKGHITIAGSNWSSIQLCLLIAKESKRKGYINNVTLILPSAGPMANMIPNYLSKAIIKRLEKLGIEVITYSQIRYIENAKTSFLFADTINRPTTTNIENMDNNNNNNNNKDSQMSANLVIYLSKAFDSLSTSAFVTDTLIISNDYLLPYPYQITDNNINHNQTINQQSSTNNDLLPFYHMKDSHRFLYESGLEYDSIGTIKANSFLSASSDVFVAGDIANVLSPLGRAVFSGYDHAIASGKVAGRNMTGDRVMYNYIPVFETDYGEDVGLHFLLLGNCASSLESHGLWWKYKSKSPPVDNVNTIVNSNLQLHSKKSEESITLKRNESSYIPYGKLRLTYDTEILLDTNIHQNSVTDQCSWKPPLGLGLIFYLKNNRIVGILISGLSPYLSNSNISETIHKKKNEIMMNDIKERAKEFLGKDYRHYNNMKNNNNNNLEKHSKIEILSYIASYVFHDVDMNTLKHFIHKKCIPSVAATLREEKLRKMDGQCIRQVVGPEEIFQLKDMTKSPANSKWNQLLDK